MNKLNSNCKSSCHSKQKWKPKWIICIGRKCHFINFVIHSMSCHWIRQNRSFWKKYVSYSDVSSIFHFSVVNPFIIDDVLCQMIEKMQTSRSAVIRNLNVHTYELNESCTSTVPTIVSGENITDLRPMPNVKNTSIKAEERMEYDWTWLAEESNCKSMQRKCITKKSHFQMTQKKKKNFKLI